MVTVSVLDRGSYSAVSLPEAPGEDEADALAIALCHAHSMGIPQRKRAAASWRDFRP